MKKLSRFRLIGLGIILTLAGFILLFTITIPYMNGFHYQLHKITRSYAFDYVCWELNSLAYVPDELLSTGPDITQEMKLRREMETVLKKNGIGTFPPVFVKFEKPPYLLVISPKDRILYADRCLLQQNLSIEEIESLEATVDRLGVSALVVELGGFGAVCPPIVNDKIPVESSIDVAVEEWFHQYLAFTPLGFKYLLDSIGIRQDPEIILMNETLAGIVSREIGTEIEMQYYDTQKKEETIYGTNEFNFNTELRKTRMVGDYYLSRGKIAEAEYYMELRRQEFVAHGYYIRKLNQAYFAFHGIYGESPSAVSPIYSYLQQLRAESPTLKYFIDEVSTMRKYVDLLEAIK
jgi:hypothetical protein